MSRIHSSTLQQLLLQAKFAPENKRLQQLDACEAIVRLIKPGHEYPYEFVCFHLTGYRPHSGKDFDTGGLLSYGDLISDIPAYAAQLSKTLRIPSGSIEQKVYTVESLTSRFRVCRKTISRWRGRGLVGRYVLFPDGRVRLAFKETSVDYFVRQNRRKVSRSRNFTLVSAETRQGILTRLAKWSKRCPNHRQQAIHRTARRFSRSVETIRAIVAQAEKDGFHEIQFNRRLYSMLPELRGQIFQQYQEGVAIDELTRRFGRSKSNIYHAINTEQAERLLNLDISYIPSDEFCGPEEKTYMLEAKPGVFPQSEKTGVAGKSSVSGRREVLEHIGAYINDIHRTDLLTTPQERFLFCRYNYLKYLAERIQKQIDRSYPSARLINRMRFYLNKAKEDKNHLIRSNLRLVVSVARRHTRNESEMSELISEGNVTLMNAVEKFSYSRGVKFSTYATWALVKRYATLRTKLGRHPIYQADDEMLEVVRNLRVKDSRVLAVESARKSLEQVISENLEEREGTIVREHFGLIKQTEITGQRKHKSLSQIAQVLGISKERVRKIELFALHKLRKVLTVEQFDLITHG